MAVKIGDVTIRIGASTAQLEADLRKAERALSASAARFQSIGQSMTIGITVPVLAAGAAAFKMASDYEESLNKVRVSFGESSKSVEDFAKTTLTSFGIAEGSALEMAGLFGNMATSMGITQKDAAKLSTEMVGLAGDMASFNNVPLDQVQTALNSIFTGEAEPLKRFGINMLESSLASFALSQGISKSVKSMTDAEKISLRYAFVLNQTKNAQGDFARTSDGAANQMRIVQESVKQLGAQFGKELLPAITPVIQKLNGLLQRFTELDPATKKTVVTVAALAASIGPLVFITGKLISVYGMITAPIIKMIASLVAQAAASTAAAAANGVATTTTVAFGTALKATLLVAAPYIAVIGAIAAGIYLLYKNYQSADKAASTLNEVQKESAKSMAAEKAQGDRLIKVINDETKSKQDKKKALDELIASSPEYFKGLTIEKDGIKKINEQYNNYIANLKAASFARAAQTKQDELAVKILNEEAETRALRKQIAQDEIDAAAESARGGASLERQGINYARTRLEQNEALYKSKLITLGQLNKESEFLSEIINKNKQITPTPTGDDGGGGGIGDQLKKDLAKIATEIANVDKLFKAGLIAGSEASEQKLKLLQERLKLLVINGFKPTSKAVIDTKNDIQNLEKELGSQFINVDVLDEFSKKFANLDKQIQAGTKTSFQTTSEKVQLLTDEMQRLKDEGIAPTSEEFIRLTKIYNNLAQETDGVVKNIAALITKVKDVSDPIAELGNTVLSDVSKQITIIQDKTKAGLISSTDADLEKINVLESAISDLIEQGFGDSDLVKKLQEQLKGIDKPVSDIFELLGKKFENIFNIPAGKGKEIAEAIAGGIGSALNTLSQLNSNREAELDNYYQKEKERIESSIGNEESKAAAIKALDEDVAKKKRAIARKQAAIDKAAAIFSATINAATAVVKALPNPILAGIVAALAAAQIAAIAAAPLPSLAVGTDLVKSDGLAMIHKGEAIVPADVAKGGYSGGGGIANVVGRIQGTDIILASDYSMNFKNRIR